MLFKKLVLPPSKLKFRSALLYALLLEKLMLPEVAVIGKAVFAILGRDAVAHGVVDRNVFAAQFESIAVTVRVHGSVAQRSVLVGDAVLEGHPADGACVGLGIKVPAVVDVVVGVTASEDVAFAGGQLGGKSVRIFTVAVGIVVGFTLNNLVVRRPLADLGIVGVVAGKLQSQSRLAVKTQRSMMLLSPESSMPLSPASLKMTP